MSDFGEWQRQQAEREQRAARILERMREVAERQEKQTQAVLERLRRLVERGRR